jgi:hypothetical protein
MVSHAPKFLAVLAVLLVVSSPAEAGPLAEQLMLRPAQPVRQREVLNLSMPSVATPTPAQYRAQAQRNSQDFSAHAAVAANEDGRSRLVFAIHWYNNPSYVSPQVASLARNFRHNGLPIVHLWQSGRNLLAIGLNPHGKPGIYFTQQLPD